MGGRGAGGLGGAIRKTDCLDATKLRTFGEKAASNFIAANFGLGAH